MRKILLLSMASLLWAGDAALAQEPPAGRDQPAPKLQSRDLPENGGAGVRTGNITSTGATVPNPGASQGAGTTSLDRGVQAQDNKIQDSICKGC